MAAGDCMSCHVRGGEALAGGLELNNPFGDLRTEYPAVDKTFAAIPFGGLIGIRLELIGGEVEQIPTLDGGMSA